MHSGKLWTPEGFAFEPQDGAWWGLIVRQARCFKATYAELGQVRREAEELRQLAVLAGAVGPVGPSSRRARGADPAINTPPSNTGVNTCNSRVGSAA